MRISNHSTKKNNRLHRFIVELFVCLSWFVSLQLADAAEVSALIGADVLPYHQAIDGFSETSHLKVDAVFDMKGDFQVARSLLHTIENELQPELILAVGVWALQAVLEFHPNTPVIYAMVLNPSNLIDSEMTGVTGASMNIKVSDSLNLIRQLNPDIKRVGTIYNKQNTGFLIERAKSFCSRIGIELITREIKSPKQALSGLQELEEEQIDILWLLPEKDILGNDFVEQIMMFSYRENIPVIGYSLGQVEMGAVMSLSMASSKDIGRQAGELANQMMDKDAAITLPFTSVESTVLFVNLITAKKLQLKLPESLVNRAFKVIE